eukprot:COSAG02_NODE_2169_length_9601_cov_233.346138_4_plen_199_part_00
MKRSWLNLVPMERSLSLRECTVGQRFRATLAFSQMAAGAHRSARCSLLPTMVAKLSVQSLGTSTCSSHLAAARLASRLIQRISEPVTSSSPIQLRGRRARTWLCAAVRILAVLGQTGVIRLRLYTLDPRHTLASHRCSLLRVGVTSASGCYTSVMRLVAPDPLVQFISRQFRRSSLLKLAKVAEQSTVIAWKRLSCKL